MQADKLIDKIKNHPTFTVLIFVGTLVIALASFTDAVTKLTGLTETISPEQARLNLAKMAVPYDGTHFVETASGGDLPAVKLFLTAGIDPNVRATEGIFEGMTALMASALRDRLEIVEVLLKAKADVNSSSSGSENLTSRDFPDGATALSYAVKNEKIFNLLLTHGANDQSMKEAFLTAACLKDIDRFKALWSLLKTPEELAPIALLRTTSCSDETTSDETDLEVQKIVDFLLQQGIGPNVEIDGWGALHYASLHGMPQVVKSLLAAGADVNQRCSCRGYGDGGWNPLLLSLRNFDNSSFSHNNKLIEAVFDLLLEHGADVNAVSDDGRTALMWAIENANENIVTRLIEKGADIEAKLTPSVGSHIAYTRALIFALGQRREEADMIAKTLLLAGADVNSSDSDGWTALMRAVDNEFITPETVELLVRSGADTHAKNAKGEDRARHSGSKRWQQSKNRHSEVHNSNRKSGLGERSEKNNAKKLK